MRTKFLPSLFLFSLLFSLLATLLFAQPAAAIASLRMTIIAPTGVAIGASLPYTVRVINEGTDPATNVLARVTLPAGVEYLNADGGAWVCPRPPLAGREVACRLATLNAGATATFVISTFAPTSPGPLTANPTVEATGLPATASAPAVTDVTSTALAADLSVTIRPLAAVNVGSTFDAIVEVNSDRPARNVSLTLTLSPYLNALFTPIQPAMDCVPRGVSWILICNLGDLPGGPAAVSRIIRLQLPRYDREIPLLAQVVGDTADTHLANNTASTTIVVNVPTGDADVRVRGDQRRPVNPVTPGALVRYVVEPGDWGPQGVNITSRLTAPSGFTLIGTDSLPGFSCDTNTLAALCSASVAPIADYYAGAITVYALAPATPGAYTTNLDVTGDRSDPDLANNLATINTTVASAAAASATADLAISTELARPTAAPGTHVAYTVRVRNLGPANASNVELLAPVFEPGWIESVEQADYTAPAGWNCVNVYGQGFHCSKANLTPAEGDQTIVFHLVAPPTPGSYSDRVGVGSDRSDPNPANNVATTALTVVAGTPPAADLVINGITYNGAPHAVRGGTPVQVRMKLLNRGPDAAANPYVLLRLPVGFSFVSTLCPAGWSGSPAGHIMECRRASFALTPSGSDGEAFDVEVLAPTVTSRAEYSVRAYFNSDTWNSFSYYEPYSGVGIVVSNQETNLRVRVSESHDPVNVGTTFTHTISVTNVSATSTGLVGLIADIPGTVALLRARVNGRDLLVARGPGWLWGHGGEELAPGRTLVFELSLRAPEAAGRITSRYTAYAGDVESDLSDNLHTEETTFTIGTITANLNLSRTPLSTTVCAGAPFSYRLTVGNTGPEIARDLKLVETLPAGATMSTITPDSPRWSCRGAAEVYICQRDSLAVSASSALTFYGVAPIVPGAYATFAGVAGSTADNNTVENRSVGTLNVTACAMGYELDWWTVDGGGQTFATGGSYRLSNTAGQPDAGNLSGGSFTLGGGFWYPVAAPRSVGAISPELGGEVKHKGSAGLDLHLVFPGGAAVTPLHVVVSEGAETDEVNLFGVVGHAVTINAYQVDGTPVSNFAKPFVLTVQYNPALLGGGDESQLTLAFWDVTNKHWVDVVATLDSNANTLSVELDHLTTFAVRRPVTAQIFLPLVAR